MFLATFSLCAYWSGYKKKKTGKVLNVKMRAFTAEAKKFAAKKRIIGDRPVFFVFVFLPSGRL